jgi:hypothetical protein
VYWSCCQRGGGSFFLQELPEFLLLAGTGVFALCALSDTVDFIKTLVYY